MEEQKIKTIKLTPTEFVKEYQTKNPSLYNWPTVEIDQVALITLIEKYDIKSIFEFGTWEGYTTELLASHPNVEGVTTLDINSDIDVDYEHAAHIKTNKNSYGKFITQPNVTQVFCDSLKFETTITYDMVFIDGNHDFQHVINDTEIAYKMKPKIIVWHDYNSPGNNDVRDYINELIKSGKDIKVFPESIVAYIEVNNE